MGVLKLLTTSESESDQHGADEMEKNRWVSRRSKTILATKLTAIQTSEAKN